MKRGMFDLDEMTGRHLDWALFRRFLRLLGPSRGLAVAAMALLPVATAARLVQPLLIKLAIDHHIVPGRMSGLGRLALLLLAAACVESLIGFWQGYLAQGVGQQVAADLRRRGFRHLLQLPVAWFDRHPSGRLVTRLTSDVENIGELFGSGVAASFGEVVALLLVVAAMFWLSPALTLVAFALLPLLGVVLLLFRRRMRQAMRQVRARLAGLNGYLAERIAGWARCACSVRSSAPCRSSICCRRITASAISRPSAGMYFSSAPWRRWPPWPSPGSCGPAGYRFCGAR